MEKICENCKVGFYIRPCRNKTARYCSTKCYSSQGRSIKYPLSANKKISLALKGKKKSPAHTEKIREFWRGNPRFGKLSPTWKGGITPLRKRIRCLLKYKNWRTAVFQRDNYTCIWCKIKSQKGVKVYLHADHIKSFSDIIKENNIKTIKKALNCKELWNIKNGRTLCKPCHMTTSNYLVKGRTYETKSN